MAYQKDMDRLTEIIDQLEKLMEEGLLDDQGLQQLSQYLLNKSISSCELRKLKKGNFIRIENDFIER